MYRLFTNIMFVLQKKKIIEFREIKELCTLI